MNLMLIFKLLGYFETALVLAQKFYEYYKDAKEGKPIPTNDPEMLKAVDKMEKLFSKHSVLVQSTGNSSSSPAAKEYDVIVDGVLCVRSVDSDGHITFHQKIETK